MSILLEALRQKSRNDTNVKSQEAPSLTISPAPTALTEPQDVASEGTELSLEALLEPLNIQPPEHLSWQLSAANTRHENDSDILMPVLEVSEVSEAVDDDHALELLFPIADEHFAISDQPTELLMTDSDQPTELLMTDTESSIMEELPAWSLVGITPAAATSDVLVTEAVAPANLAVELPISMQQEQHDAISQRDTTHPDIPSSPAHEPELLEVPVIASEVSSSHVSPEHTVPDVLSVQQDADEIVSVPNSPPLNAATKNTATAASSYLNLLNKTRKTPEQPVLTKKIRLQNTSVNPKFLMVTVLFAAVAGMGYYGYALWEEDQQQLANQLARYEAPIEMPVPTNEAAPSTSEIVPEAAPETSQVELTGLPVPLLETAESDKMAAHDRSPKPAVVYAQKRRQAVDPVSSEHQTSVVVTKSLPISTLLTAGWNSWHQGDMTAAEQSYRQVLERQPNNRDALMGMFAITQLQPSTVAQSQDIAERLIDLYPQDDEVKSLLAHVVYSGGVSAENNESYLKNQLLNTPNNAAIYYQLGVIYANSKRWSDAQAAFFKAVSLDSGQPEYLANLAISYDQLGKTNLAISGYQQALEATRKRPTNLNQDALLTRLQFLSVQASGGE